MTVMRTQRQKSASRLLLTATALALLGTGLSGCDKAPDKPRKTASVKLLPDTPPPPPPPPKPEDKPPPPKPDDKPAPQDAPKPADTPPQPAALKSDEAAGNGPGNGLSAGAVTQDYAGEKIGSAATVGGTGTADAGTRLAHTAYANATTRALNEFLARDKTVKLRDYQVHVSVWLTASGALQRAELTDSTGDADTDQALRAALARFPGSVAAPPPRLPQPLRLRVSNRMMG
jgi:protein TonB